MKSPYYQSRQPLDRNKKRSAEQFIFLA
jgi:hypothetical protein